VNSWLILKQYIGLLTIKNIHGLQVVKTTGLRVQLLIDT